MTSKLTLTLNEDVIEEAKAFAKSNDTSVSKLVENYLISLTQKRERRIEEIGVTKLVKSLSGVIELEDDFDYKKERLKYLIENINDHYL